MDAASHGVCFLGKSVVPELMGASVKSCRNDAHTSVYQNLARLNKHTSVNVPKLEATLHIVVVSPDDGVAVGDGRNVLCT